MISTFSALIRLRAWRVALGLSIVLGLGLVPARARAHEYWLSPSVHSPAPGQSVEIGALAGTGFRGEPKPWSPARAVRFVARTAKALDLRTLGRPGDLVWARLVPSDPGGTLVAYESNFASIELPASEFDAYLRLEGLDGPLAARAAGGDRLPVRERYRRCAKTWLAGEDAARASRPVGMPLEIVPLDPPGAGAELRLRLLWQGRPLAGALLKAWRSPFTAAGVAADPASRDSCGVAWQQRTDARGEARVPLAADGEWMVAGVQMVASGDRRVADWESSWASLTFERRAASRPAP